MTEETQSAVRPPLSRGIAMGVLAALGILYAVLIVTYWNRGYVDFGDGNYMYISWRLTQGAMLYRDVLAPQPPMHFVVGAPLAYIGRIINDPVAPFRVFSLLLHIGTMFLVYAATLRMTGGSDPQARARNRSMAVIASTVYMLLPVGFWWTAGYQSEPLEMAFMLGSFILLLRWSPRAAMLAGALGALATLTNMTAAPYALFTLGYVLVRRPRLFLHYAIPMIGVLLAVMIVAQITTGAYLENVILNQVGSFPRKEFLPPGQNLWTYAWNKIIREGNNTLGLEGGFIFLGLLGLIHYSFRGPGEIREYAASMCFFALCSIIYVSKGGTMNYIFTIGEPFLAIVTGWFVVWLWRSASRGPGASPKDFAPIFGILTAMLIAVCTITPGVKHIWRILNQQTYELDEYRTSQVVDLIRSHTRPGDFVLSPPYYALLAQRPIAEDYSEIFLWSLKYHNEKYDKIHGRGVQTVEKIARLLSDKKIKFIALDMDQTANIPEIREAIEANYEPLRKSEFRTLNTRLQFYVPKS